MTDSIAPFVAYLARVQTGALIDQYALEVPGLDYPGGAAIRCGHPVRLSRAAAPCAAWPS